ncbi:hypothetical protein D3C86_1685020 [compost metagenome]
MEAGPPATMAMAGIALEIICAPTRTIDMTKARCSAVLARCSYSRAFFSNAATCSLRSLTSDSSCSRRASASRISRSITALSARRLLKAVSLISVVWAVSLMMAS